MLKKRQHSARAESVRCSARISKTGKEKGSRKRKARTLVSSASSNNETLMAHQTQSNEAIGKSCNKLSERPFRIARDDVKGRVLIATKALSVEDILFNEAPLVAGSWHAHRCIECHEVHASSSCSVVKKQYPALVVAKLRRIESVLTKMDAIGELDRARALIKALNLCRQSPEVLHQILQCSTENMEDCRKCIALLQRSEVTSAVIPVNISPEEAAAILSVLNTNSHELGEWGGSGLFPLACVMEHSCVPNCNFTAHGKQL